MKKAISLSFLVVVVWLSFALAQPQTFSITFLHTNDFHGADMELLAKRAWMVNRIRKETKNPVLLLDAGDIFTRGRYAKRFYGELEFAVMNLMKYDAITLGNNEFKATGDISAQQHLFDRIKQAQFPVLCANLFDAKTGAYLPGVKPYIIKEYDGIKLAIFGVTSPKSQRYRQTKGWQITDPIETGIKIRNQLQTKADLIIALTHIGFYLDRVLAEQKLGLGAIIGGDTHTILLRPELIEEQPIVQAGDHGYFLGRLDLVIEKQEAGWKVKEFTGALIDLDQPTIEEDPTVKRLIESYLSLKQAS